MGTIRAHSEKEIEARREEILGAAEKLIMAHDWSSVTLAQIAAKTSISRTSIYNYYRTKEEVFWDLLLREYKNWHAELELRFPLAEGNNGNSDLPNNLSPITRSEFCQTLVGSFWERKCFLRLVYLSSEIPFEPCGADFSRRYRQEMQSLYGWLFSLLKNHFPLAAENEISLFLAQFVRYLVTIHGLTHISDEQLDLMKGLGMFATVADTKSVCYDGLMLLSSRLE